MDLTYDYEHLGETTDVINDLVAGKHPFFKQLAAAKNPVVIVGSECLQGEDGGAIMAAVKALAEKVSGCLVNYIKNP